MNGKRAPDSRFAEVFYAIQFFYGGWFLFHGLNWWLRYFPEHSFAPGAQGLIPDLIRMGLFDLVKVLEVVIGLALLCDVFVPLAIVAAVPITLVIAWVNAAHGRAFGLSVGAVILALNGLMAIGHLDRYRPMLAIRAGPPIRSALRPQPEASVPARLPLAAHLLAIALGVAVPAAITYGSIYFARPVGAVAAKPPGYLAKASKTPSSISSMRSRSRL